MVFVFPDFAKNTNLASFQCSKNQTFLIVNIIKETEKFSLNHLLDLFHFCVCFIVTASDENIVVNKDTRRIYTFFSFIFFQNDFYNTYQLLESDILYYK